MPKEGKPERGFLETAIAATPAGIGAGVSLRNMLKAGTPTVAGGPSLETGIRAAMASTVLPGVPDVANHLEYMTKQGGFFRGTGVDVAREAWVQAMGAADATTHKELLDFTQNLRNLKGGSVADAIEETLRTNQSQTMGKVFKRFQLNVDALTAHQQLTGNVPKYKPFHFTGSGKTLESLGEVPELVRKRLLKIGEGTFKFTEAFQYDRSQFPGFTSFRAVFEGPKGLTADLLLPMVHEGAMLEGVSMRTRYIAPDVAIYDPELRQITQRMSRPEYMLEQFKQTIVPAVERGEITTQTQLDIALRKMREETFHKLETISNVPASVSQAEVDALRRVQEVKGQAVDIRVKARLPELKGSYRWRSAFEVPTEPQMAHAMELGGFGGGTSPTAIAEGRVMGTAAMAQWQATPEAADWSRRMEQAMREYTLTAEASGELVRNRHYMAAGALNTSEMGRAWRGETLPPQLRTMYVDPSKFGRELLDVGIDDGAAIANRNVTGALEQQSIRHKHLMIADQEVLKSLDKGKQPKPGTLLGWTTEGDPFTVSKNQRLLSRTTHQSTSLGEFATLHFMETRKIGRWEKFFGDLKAVVNFKEGSMFQAAANRFTNQQKIAHGFEVIAGMDELKKNRALHNKQIISSMWQIMYQQNYEASRGRAVFDDPIRLVRKWSSRATSAGVYSRERFVQQAMEFATKQMSVTPQEFGTIFGAVPYTMGEGTARELAGQVGASGAAIKAMESGLAGGRAQLFYGGPGELRGAGAMGSIEPRAFEMLKGGAFGGASEEFAEDIARRLRYTSPEKMMVHQELAKTLESLTTTMKAPKGVTPLNLSDLSIGREQVQTMLEGKGGWMRPGKGFGDIYVPGGDTLRSLQPYRTPGGVTVRGELADVFHTLAARGGEMHADEPLSASKMRATLRQSAGDLFRQFAPGGKGQGAYQRGKMMGSVFLTGVSPGELGVQLEEGATGIPRRYAKQIFGEMEEMARAGMYSETAIEDMRSRFMAGEAIPGGLARHPFTAMGSLQPTKLQVMNVAEPVIAIPTGLAKVKFADPALGSKTIRLGPAIAAVGDFDADIYSAMLVSPDVEKKLSKDVLQANSDYVFRNIQNQTRMELIKAKGLGAAADLIDIESKMLADVQKLGTVQRWVPRLSVDLTQARQAVLSNLKGQQLADAQFLLWWMEQTPIGAKNLSAEDVASGRLRSSLQSFSSALRATDIEAGTQQLTKQVQSVVKGNDIASRLLQGSLKLTDATELEKFAGRSLGGQIQGIDVEATGRQVLESLQKFRESGEQQFMTHMAGRGRPPPMKDIPSLLARMKGPARGAFAEVSSAVQAASNVMGEAGRTMIKNYKPLALGLAGSLAIAAVLSSPSDTIGPGRNLANVEPKMNVGAAANAMKPQNVHPPGQAPGQPSAPPMLHRNSKRIMPGSPSPRERFEIRARTSSMINSGTVAENLQQMTGGNRSVSVNVRDYRSQPSSHLLANKLFG